MDAISDGLWDWNLGSGQGFFNDQYYRILGYEPRGFPSSRHWWVESVHQEDRERVLARELECIENRSQHFEVECRRRAKNGAWKWVQIRGEASWRSRDGRAVRLAGIMVDISQRKRPEEPNPPPEGMVSSVELVKGLAGCFNDIFSAILLNLSQVQRTAQAPETGDPWRNLEVLTRRAAELIEQLQDFSGQRILNTEPVDLRETVRKLGFELRQILGERITVTIAHPDRLPKVLADRAVLEKVLLQLSKNARDAMPDGGKLHFELRAESVSAPLAKARPGARSGQFVCLSIGDTGAGMDDSILKKIFKPFFTTKGSGGMGLAMAHGIVQQLQGWIEVESRVGEGSTFRIYFPALDDRSEA
jgi:PAS domain S-box-containing protein